MPHHYKTLVAVATLLLAVPPTHAQTAVRAGDAGSGDQTRWRTERISVSTSGAQASPRGWDLTGFTPSISRRGRFVAFASSAPNLVPRDTNGAVDVFVRDTHRGTTRRVSAFSGGRQFDGDSRHPSISADGRFVAFESTRSGRAGVFIRDRRARRTFRVSVGLPDGFSGGYEPSISGDGRFVAFTAARRSRAGGSSAVFLRDRNARTTTRVSHAARGGDLSSEPAVSAAGRFVAFSSAAQRTSDGSVGAAGVYVRDRRSGTTVRVPVRGGFAPAVSADGGLVAIAVLRGGSCCGQYGHYFVWHRTTGALERVSRPEIGRDPDSVVSQDSPEPVDISPDGRWVVFVSVDNLVAADTNTRGRHDVYVRDLVTGDLDLVSMTRRGRPANDDSMAPVVTDDGRVAYLSTASDLVPHDTNGRVDVFVAHRR